MSGQDCGYCEKLLCGGSISDEKLFFTLSSRMLCDISSVIIPCSVSDRKINVDITQIQFTQEQLDYLNSFSIPESGAQVFNVDFPNNLASEVDPGDLLPGANAAIRVPIFRIDANYPLCRDIIVSIRGQFTNIGPGTIPDIFPYLIHFVDSNLNIIGSLGPTAPGPWSPGETAYLEVTGILPASVDLTYLFLSVPSLDILPGGFSTASLYSITNFEISSATPTVDCPDPNVLNTRICNLPRENRDLNASPMIFCDENGAYIRHYRYGADGNMLAPITTDINLSPYFAVGVESICSGGAIPVIGSGGVVTIF